jgi:hypothetical protein
MMSKFIVGFEANNSLFKDKMNNNESGQTMTEVPENSYGRFAGLLQH